MAEITRNWNSRIFFDALGFGSRNYYFRLVSRGNAYIWDNVAEAWAIDTTWADSAITMTVTTGTGDYPVVIPSTITGVQEGGGQTMEVVIYRRAGSSPVNTDIVESNYVEKLGGVSGF